MDTDYVHLVLHVALQTETSSSYRFRTIKLQTLYKKIGAFQKTHTITVKKFFFLIDTKDNSKLIMYIKFYLDFGSTSGYTN